MEPEFWVGNPLADDDSDGILNLVEFPLGLDPKQTSSAPLPQVQRIGTNLVMNVTQPVGVSGITYGAEWRPTMAAGSWLPVSGRHRNGKSAHLQRPDAPAPSLRVPKSGVTPHGGLPSAKPESWSAASDLPFNQKQKTKPPNHEKNNPPHHSTPGLVHRLNDRSRSATNDHRSGFQP